jgi:cysteine synthase
MPVFLDNVESIGRTPLVRINRLTGPLEVNLLARGESL